MNYLKIESLKKAKRKGFYDVITSEGKYLLSENIIVQYTIINGAEFEKNEFDKIIKKNEDEKIINSVYSYIAFKMRSENEIKDYLVNKNASNLLIEKCIRDLKNLGYINDNELAKAVMNYTINNHKGPKALEMKLKERGIDNKIVDATCKLYDDDKENEVISLIIDSIISKYQKYPIKKQKQKIQEKLLRDGFSSNIVFNQVSKLNLVFSNDDELEKDILKVVKTLQNYKYKDCKDYEIKNKFINKMLSKGYSYNDISKYIDKYIELIIESFDKDYLD